MSLSTVQAVVQTQAITALHTGNLVLDTIYASLLVSFIAMAFSTAGNYWRRFYTWISNRFHRKRLIIRIPSRDSSGEMPNFLFERVRKHVARLVLSQRQEKQRKHLESIASSSASSSSSFSLKSLLLTLNLKSKVRIRPNKANITDIASIDPPLRACSAYQTVSSTSELELHPPENESFEFDFKGHRITYVCESSRMDGSHGSGFGTMGLMGGGRGGGGGGFFGGNGSAMDSMNGGPNGGGNGRLQSSAMLSLSCDESTNKMEDAATSILAEFVRHVSEEALNEQKVRQRVDVYVNSYSSWTLLTDIPVKPLNSLVLDDGIQDALSTDVDWFLNARGYYEKHSIPYRRSYLFYGPPGCGKTSLILSLASMHGRVLQYLSLNDVANDEQLRSLFVHAQPNSIILIEDIDCLSSVVRSRSSNSNTLSDNHDNHQKPAQLLPLKTRPASSSSSSSSSSSASASSSSDSESIPDSSDSSSSVSSASQDSEPASTSPSFPNNHHHMYHQINMAPVYPGFPLPLPLQQQQQQQQQSRITLSGLLNCLDGAFSRESVIVCMTTNHVELIDEALLRPGRVDVRQYIGLCTRSQAYRLFLKFFPEEEFVESKKFESKFLHLRFSPAEVSSICHLHRNMPQEALRILTGSASSASASSPPPPCSSSSLPQRAPAATAVSPTPAENKSQKAFKKSKQNGNKPPLAGEQVISSKANNWSSKK